MAIRVGLHHLTEYRYDREVGLTPHVIRLRPCVHSRTPILAYSLNIEPANHFLNWQQDPFGNWNARVVFPEKTTHLKIVVDLVADMTVINPFDFFLEEYAEEWPFDYPAALKHELSPYLKIRESGPRLMEWLGTISREKRRTIDFLVDVNSRLNQALGYVIRLEAGVQSCEETFEVGKGSCRDFSYLLVQALRHLGLAARFVSGYSVQLTPDEKSLDGPSGVAEDVTDLHAWAEVYIPGAGWVGLDATSGLFAGEGHIPLSCTPEPASAAPVVGGVDPCESEFIWANEVTRVHEDPRVTKPYSDTEWEAIDALGAKVDEVLEAGDVALTMGGEPTFVSIDDMEGAEWNVSADSPAKRKLALSLLGRLRNYFGPSGLLHYGEGKWYPGEPLPRWAYTVLWRKDGQALWKDERLLADPNSDPGHGIEDARRFASQVVDQLGCNQSHLIAGFEDAFYYAWRESTLPANVDPYSADLDDPLERRYLATLLDRGLSKPTGFALPLEWDAERDIWQSSLWTFRRGRMSLVPGGSPMGFRLPLDSLPKAPDDQDTRQAMLESSPLEPKSDLPAHGAILPAGRTLQSGIGFTPAPPEPADSGKPVPQTAIVFEPRHGKLHVFFPPVTHLEHYLTLLEAVENVAARLKLPVIIEGYEMPWDRRIERIKVTPDPGVIEVNVHPVTNWRDLVENTTTLYEAARLSRLGTEKFMLDGRHTGTGGGNHVTLGGETPDRSPFLRKPGLLRSLITYWQHHPGLSYLFSGLFLGPTSQAPRADEGRDDRLFELEIAFSQLPEAGDPPWMVDRVLRNMLTDLTGNTHRAEFCIDKLYAPGAASGRLGILELRAFEMPPHARMSLVQMLLVRSLVAKFWNEPYHGKLVRWGTELHDRFMLPHFVRQDLIDVALDLKNSGIPFEAAWLEPFHEFRFPVYGRVCHDGVEMEIRAALEPWHVLGEESSSTGTARYVDSSVERVQVKIRNMVEGRHVLVCNGRRIPLQPTGRRGEYVAGVRYKAWDPWSAMHPTIGVHTPLTFDVVDTWNRRSLGGCVYHVVHPGGRSYESFPVNAYEAESRRVNRFWQHGHTPGVMEPASTGGFGYHRVVDRAGGPLVAYTEVPMEDPSMDFPVTLDLRR
ncbi:transglutaminase family protein [Luteolibacter sp. GHJ8]|uniref:Transglutaminase family protein n=1 Tax=Luteolibacter rhizosphaerae TaxID=2989719 RepID=A0ABT3G434_9BACT|nr:transglutaminase family protein [Luteolibacter rhizosphaerae]MCW1914607.1 transglutaminase family protein [Luteolibacter rhizosphaerae]